MSILCVCWHLRLPFYGSFFDKTTNFLNYRVSLLFQVENFTFCDGRSNRYKCKENITGEFLEIGIKVQNRKNEAGRQETEAERNKREDDKKQRLRCFKQRGQNKCPRIFLFGKDEVGVASQVKFISLVLFTVHDQLKNLGPHSQAIRSKSKTFARAKILLYNRIRAI